MSIITHHKGDLFTVENKSSLCHCVSADLRMGAGIAQTFKARYYKDAEMKLLLDQNPFVGEIVISKNGDNFIYNLVTKEAYYQKPKLPNLYLTLIAMRAHALKNDVKEISMPKIGCGLDKLKWSEVEQCLLVIFEKTEIKLHVYKL